MADETTVPATEQTQPSAPPAQEKKKRVAAKKPVKQAPKVGGIKLPASMTGDNAPAWAAGISAIITAMISLLLVLGMESVGGGLGEILSSKADVSRIESMTTAQFLQSMQAANSTLQNRAVELESRVHALEQENQELRTILKYEKGIVATPAVAGEPTAAMIPTPEPIGLPTATPDAVQSFESLLEQPTAEPSPSPTATETSVPNG